VLHDFADDMDLLRADLAKLNVEAKLQQEHDIEEMELELQELLEQMAARSSPNIAAMQAAINAATAAMAGEINLSAAGKSNRVQATLEILEILGRHLAPVPGRKSVVWVSGGLSLFAQQASTNPNVRLNPMVGNILETEMRRTSERLAQLGVVLYGVDAHGLTTADENLARRQYPPAIDGRFSEAERDAAMNLEGRAAFSLIRSVTGGRYIFGTNDFAKGVDLVSADLDGSYTLGFYTPDEPDGKWHTLKVTVRKPGLRLLHKEGYLADPLPAGPQAWDVEAQRQALTSPFGSDAIRLTARCAPAEGAAPGTLQLVLQIEAEDILWQERSDRMAASLDVYIGELPSAAELRFHHAQINARFLPAQLAAAREKGLPFRHQWKPDAGTRRIRVLVRDPSTGRLGSLDIPIRKVAESRTARD
jgi:VWFA-related protein